MPELDYLPEYDYPSILLESDGGMANSDLRIPNLESSVKTVKADIKELKDDVRAIKTDINSIKTDIGSFKGSVGAIKYILGITLPLLILWGGFITYNVIAMMNGGTAKIVAELKAPKSPEQLQANLSVVIAQVRTASVNGKKPDEQKVKALAGALTEVAKRNPELPESWRAIATLVSYSTSDIGETAQRPDCDITQTSHEIAPSELPSGDATLAAPIKQHGFVFRNCTLHMDHLPPGKVIKFMGELHTPAPVYEELTAGDIALIFDCDVILTDSGIAESGILMFKAFNSRLQFQIEKTPQLRSRDLLLASIQDPIPGEFTVKLPPSDLAATHS